MRYNKTSNVIIIIVAVLFLLTAAAGSFFIISLNSKINSLNVQIENKDKELNKTNKKISELEKQIKEKNNLIEEYKKAINTSTSSETPGNNNSKIAYLTFDDGPTANTLKILNILKENNVKATFFVIGNASKKAFTLSTLKRIKNEGHAIGVHSYSHNYRQIYQNEKTYFDDFNKISGLINEAVGEKPTIFRFPGGSNNTVSHKYGGKNIMHELVQKTAKMGYRHIDWNVTSGDAEAGRKPSAKELTSNVLARAKNQKHPVILMHDAADKSSTVEALPQIIKGLKQQGFKFEVLSQTSFGTQFYKN